MKYPKPRQRWLPLLTLTAVVLSSTEAWACGENKFRAGHGLRYQANHTHVEGTVLVYAPEQNPLAPRVLKKVGHHVVLASSMADVVDAMNAHRFDVVIAPVADVEALAYQLAMGVQSPQLVPVVRRRKELAQARDRYGLALSSVAGGRQIVALVNQIITTNA